MLKTSENLCLVGTYFTFSKDTVGAVGNVNEGLTGSCSDSASGYKRPQVGSQMKGFQPQFFELVDLLFSLTLQPQKYQNGGPSP